MGSLTDGQFLFMCVAGFLLLCSSPFIVQYLFSGTNYSNTKNDESEKITGPTIVSEEDNVYAAVRVVRSSACPGMMPSQTELHQRQVNRQAEKLEQERSVALYGESIPDVRIKSAQVPASTRYDYNPIPVTSAARPGHFVTPNTALPAPIYQEPAPTPPPTPVFMGRPHINIEPSKTTAGEEVDWSAPVADSRPHVHIQIGRR